ncbi:proteasome alpha 3 subunit-like [Planoprotostelium fungivorum]|uniref:Proteasome subunit alpha type n=1 Tax=Planoprotostelium fungivorum TaxID=1890364 RepID=A0A2P6MXC4_9EUKA|nr:proteasome alpha 3 subunit-like [Planoprotostelium fungivorum]
MFCRALPNRTQEASIQSKESCREIRYNIPFYYDGLQMFCGISPNSTGGKQRFIYTAQGQYDISCTTFSPDGRVFQIDYAGKAVENSGTAIGVRVKDGIVFGVEKLILSKMLEPSANRRIHSLDRTIGLTYAGMTADARQLVNKGRSEAKNYRGFYYSTIPTRVLNERLSLFVQAYTLYGHVRPFGCSIIIGAWEDDGPQLYTIDPSGISYGYYGTAVGKAKQAAKGELEKLKLSEMTAREAVKEIARM